MGLGPNQDEDLFMKTSICIQIFVFRRTKQVCKSNAQFSSYSDSLYVGEFWGVFFKHLVRILFQIISEQNQIILSLTQKLGVKTSGKECDGDSGVIIGEETNEHENIIINQNKINRSVSSVIEQEKYKSQSKIPRIFKSRFAEPNLNSNRSLKFKRITKAESKSLGQLRSRLCGKPEELERCSQT